MYQKVLISFFFVFSSLWNSQELLAQDLPRVPQGDEKKEEGKKETGIFNRSVSPTDTFDTQYFYLSNPFTIQEIQDTLLGANFSQPDPAYHGDYAFANLGNLGSPLSPLVYRSNIKDGLNIGFNSFDSYYSEKEELKFYKLKSPFTKAIYNQGRTQDDQYLKVEFASEFGKSLSFSLFHNRINHKGVFTNHSAKNYSLNTGFWYHHPSGRYQAFLTFTSNSTIHQENGGINLPAVSTSSKQREETVPTLLSRDTTRYRKSSYGLVHYFHLRSPKPAIKKDSSTLEQFPILPRDTQQVDSSALKEIKIIPSVEEKVDSLIGKNNLDSLGLEVTSLDTLKIVEDTLKVVEREVKKKIIYYDPNVLIPNRRQISLGHEINIFGGFYKFDDSNPDSSFYGNLNIFEPGLQYRINHKGVENSFFISTSSIHKKNPEKTQRPRDFLKLGLKYSHNKVSQLRDSMRFNNISLFGHLDFNPFKSIRLSGDAGLYLAGYNSGDFYLSGEMIFALEKIGSLKTIALSQAFAPTVSQNKLLISSFPLWENSFDKTVESKIGGVLTLDKTNTQLAVNFQLLDNYIYYDTLAIVQQASAVFSVTQFEIRQPISVGKFHLENTVVFQQSKNEILSLPAIFTKHSLYYESKIFKEKALFRIGMEGIFHTNYKARKYQPLTGQFYNSDEDLDYYPQIDPFISLKREKFRAYFRVQNASSILVPDDFGYRTPGYPVPYKIFRFGIGWLLLN